MAGYIGFLDLLGTSNLAQYNIRAHYRSLETFRTAAIASLESAADDVEVFAFSDCAYVAAEELPQLIHYLATVRSYLLSFELFLKGGVAEGRLEGKPDYREKYRGIQVGRDAVKAYALQEAMKGVGLRVHDALQGKMSGSDRTSPRLVKSCYLPEGSRQPLEIFWDISYSRKDCEYAGVIVKTMHRLRVRSARIARYYVPPLVSMVRSSDFTHMLEDDAVSMEDDALVDSLPLVGLLILRGELAALESKVPGIEQVYGAFLDEVCKQVPPESEARRRVFKFMNTERRLSRLRHVPEEILGAGARHDLAEFVSSQYLRGWPHVQGETTR